ncbi:hypothetical protein GCM10010326_76100 [Streptomyces xanthochromogenes]|uniref:Glycerol-3-phosphate dehydrogenase NAD-dependent C-terminal domain-containing protein n=1 Tax=Streptomyces xanthochromogenes TaxID=67384 RepID=A0ABQ3AXP8_9ACTN|nr:hypothetical protein GCM10010326_76100 [Streptomyces xanthochromogenes]
MSEVITEVTRLSKERVAVVSGPNLAREIAEKQQAASVIANTDVIGCELGGAVKNVIALAVGLASGMGLGHTATALLATRGLAETARLGTILGAGPLTFSGLAGVGDLITTCSSPLSRNRTFGEHLGQGMTVDEAAITTKQMAEGVKSSAALLALAHRYGVEMPISEVVVDVIKGRIDVRQAAERLMARAPRPRLIGPVRQSILGDGPCAVQNPLLLRQAVRHAVCERSTGRGAPWPTPTPTGSM